MSGRRPVTRPDDGRSPAAEGDVRRFLEQVARTPAPPRGAEPGRLLFAIDATASREPAWDMACHLQNEMFLAARDLGGLEVQLCYYRGFLDVRATPWVTESQQLVAHMSRVQCLAGRTRIGRLLRHAIRENGRRKINAMIFVGDVVEEDIDTLGDLAGRLGLAGVPVFVFQEGDEPASRRAFEQIAMLSGGAWSPFNTGSAGQLRALLGAVAAFSAGGRPALADYSRRGGEAVQRLARQIGPN